MKYVYLFFIGLFSTISFSQNELIKEATTFLNSNKIFTNNPKEKFFLHTNKTTYFAGEAINYKAYVVSDDTNLPSQITTNLHFSVYDYNGEMIKHQLVFVENGTVYGSIKVEKELKSGTYYLELDTNYNASFDRKNINEIQIINLEDKNTNISDENDLIDAQVEPEMDLQVAFFPESDVLLSRANNTLYYKISIDGLPLETKGELVNSFNNVVVGAFISNKEGMGSVTFVYDPNREFYFKIWHNQKEYKINVPMAQKEGFVIHYDSSKSNLKEANFIIRINNDTAIKNDNETILAVIHRNNTCKSVIPFKIKKDKTNYLLSISSENLFNGVNIITLFNKRNVVLSGRYFFHDKNKNIELSIEKVKETKDSLTLDLKMPNNFIQANTSVSILPEQSIVNNNSNTIYNAFLITPYVSRLDNLEDIDLALQFVSQSNNDIEANKDTEIRDVENGIFISGEVQTELPDLMGYKVLLTSKENGLALIEYIKNKNKFSFNNLLLYHPSKYRLALLNPIGKVVDADFKVDEKQVEYPLDSILNLKQNSLKKEVKGEKKISESNKEFELVFEGEKLDEVVLTGQTRKEEEVNEFPDFGIIDNPGELGNGFIRKIVKKEIECMGCTLFEYLGQFWNLVTYIDALGDSHVSFATRGVNTIFGGHDALLILDGLPVHPTILTDIMASDVKAVKLNRAGAGYGFRGSNGVIMIELKKPEDYLNSESDITYTNKTIIFSGNTTFGFTKSVDLFKENNLIFKSQNSLEKYSVIDWKPNFILKPNKSNYIKISKESYTALKLIINGINDEGDMVSEEVNISLK
jgi:hypothetical protein